VDVVDVQLHGRVDGGGAAAEAAAEIVAAKDLVAQLGANFARGFAADDGDRLGISGGDGFVVLSLMLDEEGERISEGAEMFEVGSQAEFRVGRDQVAAAGLAAGSGQRSTGS